MYNNTYLVPGTKVYRYGQRHRIYAYVVVFTLHRSFYPTTSAVPPVSFLILYARDIQILWLQAVRIIYTSYQKLPFGYGDYPDKLLFHQALN